MYKLLTTFIVIFLVINCGGPKKEMPAKTTTATTPTFEAVIKTIEPMTVISIEKKGPYNEVGKTIGEMITWVMAKKIKPMGNPFGVYYDDPMKVIPESTRYEVCMVVTPETKGDKTLKVKQQPGMEVASTIYMGPYDKCGPTYEKLTTWITEKGYTISGPVREHYLNNPSETAAESLKTEIQFPITKKTQ